LGKTKIIMKRNLLTLVLLFAFLSCKKSSNTKNKDEEQSFKGCLIESATIKNQYSDERWIYTYDDKGRVIKETYSISPTYGTQFHSFTNYEYTTKKISFYGEVVAASGKDAYNGYYELDDKGRIIKSFNDDGSVDLIITYNANGYIATVDVAGEDFTSYTYFDGYLIKAETKRKYLNTIITEDFGYGVESLKNEQFDAKYFSYPGLNLPIQLAKYLGKNSKSVISKKIATRIQDNDNTKYMYIDNYTFKKDSDGNLISQTRDHSFSSSSCYSCGGTSTRITNYSYKCF